ncbi:hypothetical protein MKX01_028538 [Papaver californicum]|nr:hypothetical protein MKX01_028538 [Papaver californicum]
MRIQHQFLLKYSLFLLFLISPSLRDLGKCNPNDYKALVSIKKSVNTPNYHLFAWVQNTDNSETSGQISSSLGDLPYLGSLVFSRFSNISGSIPQSITKLKHLKMLDLSDMSSIPESFGNFTGSIPDIFLHHNKLTGPIPESLGAMDFGQIDLSGNRLVGDTSMLFNLNHGLTTHIDLSGDQLEIPEEIKGLEKLHMLKLGYNRLCGKIPTRGIMQRFKSTYFFHNKCLE